MKKRISCFIITLILIIFCSNNIVYGDTQFIDTTPYGPKVEDLKGKEIIKRNLNDIRKIRGNLLVINISETSTKEELEIIYRDLDSYSQQINGYKRNLEKHQMEYKDSFADVFFASEISLIADCYMISIRTQQNLIRQLLADNPEAKKLFYSGYLVPVYYYLTLGDQMAAYIETYFVIT